MGVRQCGVPVAGIVGLASVAGHRDAHGVPRCARLRGRAHVDRILDCVVALSRAARIARPTRLHRRHAARDASHRSRWTPNLVDDHIDDLDLRSARADGFFLTLTFVRAAGYALPVAVGLFTFSQVAAVGGRLAWGWIATGSLGEAGRFRCVSSASSSPSLPWVCQTSHRPPPRRWLAAILAMALGFTAEGWLGLSVIGFAGIGGEEYSGSALGVGATACTLLAAVLTPAVFDRRYRRRPRLRGCMALARAAPSRRRRPSAVSEPAAAIGIFRGARIS